MSTLSQRLAEQHDLQAELAAREAYLVRRRATMPGLVAHQEALARGEDIADILRRTAPPPSGRVPLELASAPDPDRDGAR